MSKSQCAVCLLPLKKRFWQLGNLRLCSKRCSNAAIEHAARLSLVKAGPALLAALDELVSALPELAHPDAELCGSDAVEALCQVWPKIQAARKLARPNAERGHDEGDHQRKLVTGCIYCEAGS